MTPNDEIMFLAQGIEAAKSGDRAHARELLKRSLGYNPRNELAWFWLGNVVESDNQRRECLMRVLQINPLNEMARQELEVLEGRRPATPPPSSKERSTTSARSVICPFCNKTTAAQTRCDQCDQDIILPCPN